MPGVIGHLVNPTIEQATELAVSAETNGAEWIGFADAFWWRDVWMILTEVAANTSHIRIGPAMTNAYMRHPFHTLSALATLQEVAADRTLLGLAAGGSEVTHAAGISRKDAATRTAALIELTRSVASGRPLDPASGRNLDVTLAKPTVLVAGRGDQMLRTAGKCADDVLMWAIPDSDLERSIAVVMGAARQREVAPRLIWAPLVRHGNEHESSLLHVAVYASLNTRRSVRLTWGLTDALVDEIRKALVSGGTEHASSLVPAAALDDLVLTRSEPETVAGRARDLGIAAMATPGFAATSLATQLGWATQTESLLVT